MEWIGWGVFLILLAAALVLAVLALVWNRKSGRRGIRGRRGRRGLTGSAGSVGEPGATGATGPASATPTGAFGSSYIGFVTSSNQASAETYQNGSLVAYDSTNTPLDADIINEDAVFFAVTATNTGFLSGLNVVYNGQNFSAEPGTGVATLYKTSACTTGFAATSLEATWDVPTGTDDFTVNGPHCAVNTTDQVPISPGDRFLLFVTITGATGATLNGPLNAGLLYTFTS